MSMWLGQHVLSCKKHPGINLFIVNCKLFEYDPADAAATLSSCCIIIEHDFTFVVPDYSGCPRKEAIKRVFVFCLLNTLKVLAS